MCACTHFDCLWQIRHPWHVDLFSQRAHIHFPLFSLSPSAKKVGCSHAGAWPTLIRRVKKRNSIGGSVNTHIQEHTRPGYPVFGTMTFSKLDVFFYIYGQRSKISTERNEDENKSTFSSTKFTAARTHLLFPESKIETDLNDRKWDPNNKGTEWQAPRRNRGANYGPYFIFKRLSGFSGDFEVPRRLAEKKYVHENASVAVLWKIPLLLSLL